LHGKENFETRREKRGAGRLFFRVRRSRGEAGWILFFGRAKKSIDKKKDIITSYVKGKSVYFVSKHPICVKAAVMEMKPES
jgi:hypothetical protein